MTKKVLLLQEDKDILEKLQHNLLKHTEYELITTDDCDEVQVLINEHDFDATIVDIKVIEGRRSELINQLIEKNIPVILLTDSEDIALKESVMTKNIVSYIINQTDEDITYACWLLERLEKNRLSKILIVEDSMVYRKMISRILSPHLFKIFQAKDGVEALNFLRENPDIKVVLTDYNMPRMDGLELTREIRKHFKRTKLSIIVVSSEESGLVSSRFLKYGANDYIRKPFTLEEFYSRIYLNLDNVELIEASVSKMKKISSITKQLNELNRTLEMRVEEELEKNLHNTNKMRKDLEIINKYVLALRTDSNGIIIDVSDAYCELCEYGADELIGKTNSVLRHPDTTDEQLHELWETIKSGKKYVGEFRNRKKSGATFWLVSTIMPEFDNDGNIYAYSAIYQEITQVKKVEEQQNQLIQQSKQAVMGEMIGMIAHQWRQPLATISAIAGNISIGIELGTIKDEQTKESMKKINDFAKYLSRTINDFRNFFKPNKEIEIASVSSLIEETLEFTEHMLVTHGVEVFKNYDTDVSIGVFRSETVQVLINIIKNAQDAMVDNEIKNKELHIKTYDDLNYAYIEIKDNGGGIPSDIIDKIFDPYFSTKSKNGTGLGLYMSRTIVEDHLNGRLSARNEDGGSIFKIDLPL